MSKFTKKCMAVRTLSDKASGWPYVSLLILTFLNRCISVKTSLINIRLKDFVNLGVLFLSMWIIVVVVVWKRQITSLHQTRFCLQAYKQDNPYEQIPYLAGADIERQWPFHRVSAHA